MPTGRCCHRTRRWRRAGIAPVELAEKEGLALINGTDGMLGMLLLALADLRVLLDHRRHHGRVERRGPARHRRGVRRGPPGAAASAGPVRVGGQHARDAGRQPDRGQPPRPRGPAGAGRLLAAMCPGGGRRRAGHRGPRRGGGRARARRGDRQPGDRGRGGRGPGGLQRQLPRGAAGLRAGLPGHRRRRRRQHRRAPHRPLPGPQRATTGCPRSWPTTRGSTRG